MSFNKDIKFANVNFSYENYQIFKNLNMKINLGDTIELLVIVVLAKAHF